MSDENDISELIEHEPTSRFGRFTKRIAEKRKKKREMRRQEKERIERIRFQERKKLERRFIRKQVKGELQKKFTPKNIDKSKVFLFNEPSDSKKKKLTLKDVI
jgi:hypothetical protein